MSLRLMTRWSGSGIFKIRKIKATKRPLSTKAAGEAHDAPDFSQRSRPGFKNGVTEIDLAHPPASR